MLIRVVTSASGTADNPVLHNDRNFFGVHRVVLSSRDENRLLNLHHGVTIHGRQMADDDGRPINSQFPLAYFFPTGPAGQAFRAFSGGPKTRRVAVVGLGAGALAAYSQPGEEFTFFDIDPAVERIATDSRYFTYLQGAGERGAKVRIVLGDARLTLADEPEANFGMLILDAFSSDAIPVHLLTREAVQLYLSKLTQGGVLLLHITNTYVDLEPVVGALAADAGLVCRINHDMRISRQEAKDGKDQSIWVMLARRGEDLGPLGGDARWKPVPERAGVSVWTDDFSSLIRAVRWWN
jgi:hypothetical protein